MPRRRLPIPNAGFAPLPSGAGRSYCAESSGERPRLLTAGVGHRGPDSARSLSSMSNTKSAKNDQPAEHPRPRSHPDRDKWIAEAAYYRAEKRGFATGYALEDWLAAEALVDFELARTAPK